MRLLVITPTKTMRECLRTLQICYEIVESAEALSEKFNGHHGPFDGVIAPSNPVPGTMRTIGENWYVKNRELPVFVFGNRVAIKERLSYLDPSRVTFAYCGSLVEALRDWSKKSLENA